MHNDKALVHYGRMRMASACNARELCESLSLCVCIERAPKIEVCSCADTVSPAA